MGLAGCPSGGNGDGGSPDGTDTNGNGGQTELGEPVETLVVHYFANAPRTRVLEAAAPRVQEDLEQLGISVEVSPKDALTMVREGLTDTRTKHVGLSYGTPAPVRTDPFENLQGYHISAAGNTGRLNSNYADCEISALIDEQAVGETDEARQEAITETLQTINEDRVDVPLINNINFGAYRSDQVDASAVGDIGISLLNHQFFIQSTASQGNQLAADISPQALQSTVFTRTLNNPGLNMWCHLVSSGLTGYNENLEIENELADTIEVSNGKRQYTVELVDGAVFHNGDPVTASDVKFTFEYVTSHPSAAPQAISVPYQSVEVIDDQTVEFSFENPYPALDSIVFPRWGILHEDIWVESGARENPSEFQLNELVGSGPFQVQSQSSSELVLEPFDDHPVYSTDYEIFFQPFTGQQAKERAIQGNEIQIANELGTQTIDNLEQNNNVETTVFQGHSSFSLSPWQSHGPTKFRAFRDAMHKTINRTLINEIAFGGRGTVLTSAVGINQYNPWHNDEEIEDTATPQGDVEAARQALSDAGWGWDDDGQLHYPPDADLSPRWPEGERPLPENHECVEMVDGEWTYVGSNSN